MEALRILTAVTKLLNMLVEEKRKGETKRLAQFESYVERQEQRIRYETKIAESARDRVAVDSNAGLLLKHR